MKKKIENEKLYIFFSFFFFNSVLRPFQDYFQLIRDGPISRWAKTGEPREKTPGTLASKPWLVSHVAGAGLEPNHDLLLILTYFTARPNLVT